VTKRRNNTENTVFRQVLYRLSAVNKQKKSTGGEPVLKTTKKEEESKHEKYD